MPIDHLPPRLRTPAERLRAWALTDAALMVILGIGCAIRGAAYFNHDPAMATGSPHPSEVWMSMDAWALVWIGVGVTSIVTSAWYRSLPARAALGTAMGLHLLWGLSLLVAGIWLYATWYLLLTVLAAYCLWRGSRTELRIREVVDRGSRDAGQPGRR